MQRMNIIAFGSAERMEKNEKSKTSDHGKAESVTG